MFYIIENMFQLPFYSTFSIFLLPCLQISENKDNQRVCVQNYQVIYLNMRSPTVSNKQLRNVRLFSVRKQKKIKGFVFRHDFFRWLTEIRKYKTPGVRPATEKRAIKKTLSLLK